MQARVWRRRTLLAGALFVAGACGGSGDIAAAPITLTFTAHDVVVEQGGAITLTGAISRAAGFTGDVTITLGSLPAGITSAITSPGQGQTWSVTLTAASNSALNPSITVIVIATGQGASTQSTFALSVRTSSASAVSVALSSASIPLTGNSRATAVVKDANGVTLDGRAITWTSSAPQVATIDNAGLITPVAVGTTTIQGMNGAITGTAVLTVTYSPDIGVPSAPVPISVRVDGLAATVDVPITNAGTGTLSDLTVVSVLAGGSVQWLNASLLTATAPTTLRLSAKESRYLPVGTYTAGVTLGTTAPGAVSATRAVSVTLTVTAVPGGVTFARLAPGGLSTCAQAQGGAVYCWGINDGGGLGDPDPIHEVHVPTRSVADNGFVGLAANTDNSTCGWTQAGVGYCWGENFYGTLGNGTQAGAFEGLFTPVPVPVLGGIAFAEMSGGQSYACGRTAAGVAYCWGVGGALGDGTFSTRLTPVPVSGGLFFKRIAAGTFETCGITVAGPAYCWGSVNDPPTNNLVVLGTVPVLLPGGLSFSDIQGGWRYECGLTVAGSVYCWGLNWKGELGDGTLTNRSTPAPVLGGLTFVQIGTGTSSSCARTAAGAVYCWGDNTYGQLGDGTTAQRTSPTLVGGGLAFMDIATAGDHVCGRATSGATYCWGNNSFGQLGDGTTTNRSLPTLVVVP